MRAYDNEVLKHEEWECRLIPSSEVDNRYYRVFIGTVLWSDNIERKACVVFTQFGNTVDWKKAKTNKEIIFKRVCHFLIEDYEKINAAIQELIHKYPSPNECS